MYHSLGHPVFSLKLSLNLEVLVYTVTVQSYRNIYLNNFLINLSFN